VTTDPVMRRLSAVLVADVAGYSRLIEGDEEGTLATLKTIHDSIVAPTVAAYRGRVVKLMGDGILAEFGSVVDAVRQAVAMQEAVAKAQSNVPDDRHIEFRIGINLGDVVIDGDDIQGDGVNIAARLERLAPPGGLCISDAVREQIGNKLAVQLEDLGDRTLKNIERTVRVWRWTGFSQTAVPGRAVEYDGMVTGPNRDNGQDGGAVMMRPAVLFLPFDALGRSEEDEALASGLCEDIRTTLACWRWFPVIGPEAVRGTVGDVRSLAETVQAGFVMNGSVRRAGDRARVIARLLDGATGQELWSQTFDGDLQNIFDFHEDISRRIVSRI